MESSAASSRSSSSSPSSSSRGSPAGSIHAGGTAPAHHGPPDLQRLVGHYVAAKRSLSASSHVYRATELVATSRASIEEIAGLNAKNVFATRELSVQFDLLNQVKAILVEDADKVSEDFAATLTSLDQADARLKVTLDALRQTILDQSLGTKVSQISASGHVAESDSPSPPTREAVSSPSKNLYDFIDETTHENLLSSLYELIDQYHRSRNDLDSDLSQLDDNLRDLIHALLEDADGPNQPTIYDDPAPALDKLFHDLETHAADMASLLHNLVNHYDLCVTALKHTEGGGEAAKQAIQAAGGTSDVPAGGAEDSLYSKAAPEPMSEEERTEMLGVLENDALEVEDVVHEVSALASEMETAASHIRSRAAECRGRNKFLRSVLVRLHGLRKDIIPHVLQLAQHFLSTTWPDIGNSLKAKTTELVDLCAFYESFLTGYEALLQEVGRRADVDRQMRRTADKARKELARMVERERKEREEFMRDVGGYLPRDIWSGLEEDVHEWIVGRHQP